MPVMSRFLKKMQPDEHPYQQFVLPLGGVLFLVAALIGEVRHHPSRALAALSTGTGMILFGIASVQFRDSRWRAPALLIAGALWVGGIYWMFTTASTK